MKMEPDAVDICFAFPKLLLVAIWKGLDNNNIRQYLTVSSKHVVQKHSRIPLYCWTSQFTQVLNLFSFMAVKSGKHYCYIFTTTGTVFGAIICIINSRLKVKMAHFTRNPWPTQSRFLCSWMFFPILMYFSSRCKKTQISAYNGFLFGNDKNDL